MERHVTYSNCNSARGKPKVSTFVRGDGRVRRKGMGFQGRWAPSIDRGRRSEKEDVRIDARQRNASGLRSLWKKDWDRVRKDFRYLSNWVIDLDSLTRYGTASRKQIFGMRNSWRRWWGECERDRETENGWRGRGWWWVGKNFSFKFFILLKRKNPDMEMRGENSISREMRKHWEKERSRSQGSGGEENWLDTVEVAVVGMGEAWMEKKISRKGDLETGE